MTSTQPTCDYDEIKSRMKRLKATLEDANHNIKVDALLEMLDECLPICPVESLDEHIFAIVLSSACQFNLKVMNEIYDELKKTAKNMDLIHMKLTICQSLLNCWQKSLEFIKQLGNLSVSKINALVSSLLKVTRDTLEHCKSSETIYALCREQFANKLKDLFRKSVTNLKDLLTLFNGKVKIETCDDFEILMQAIDKIGEMASFIKDLDLNTSIDLWKNFGKFAIKHESDFKRIESIKIVDHLQQISADIIALLPCTLQPRQLKSRDKTIAYVGLLFKILHKLFNTYCKIIPDDKFGLLVELFVEIRCYSPPCLRFLETDINIIKLVELNISHEMDLFLDTSLKNDAFIQIFFKYKRNSDEKAIGYHLLILDIINCLSKQDYEQLSPWIFGEHCLLDELLSNIDSLKLELCMGKLHISHQTENQRSLTLYEATLIASYALICQVPASNFNNVELLMLKHLLGGQLWASLLSVDLWCFVSRLGPPQLCFDHLKFLIKLYQQLWLRRNCIEVVVLHNLIVRLYFKLQDKHKDEIAEELENIDPRIRIHLSAILSDKGQTDLERQILTNGSNILIAYKMLCNLPTVDHWNNFIKELSNFGFVSTKWSDETIKTISELWSKVAKMISGDCQGTSLNLLSDLIDVLFHISRIEGNDVSTVCMILSRILESYIYMTPDLRIKTCHYLKHNTRHFTSDTQVVQWLARFYCSLLEDNIVAIKQEALESFDHFVQTCQNDDLINKVTKAIVNRPTVCEYVRAYITHESYFKTEFSSLDEYFRQLCLQKTDFFEHTCHVQDEGQRDNKLIKLEKMPSLALEQRVDSICKEIQEITKYKSQLKDDSVDKLRMALLKLVNP